MVAKPLCPLYKNIIKHLDRARYPELRYCKDSLIEKTMYRNYKNMELCQKALLKNALDTGGQDNFSIVLCATLPLNSTKCRVGLKGKIKKFLAKL